MILGVKLCYVYGLLNEAKGFIVLLSLKDVPSFPRFDVEVGIVSSASRMPITINTYLLNYAVR